MKKCDCAGQMSIFNFFDHNKKVARKTCEIPYEYVKSVLKMGSTFKGGKERIANFISKNPKDINQAMKLLKKEYGVGGCGWQQKTDGVCGYSYDGSYLQIDYMEDGIKCKGKLPYNIVACEIRTLIENGEYL